MEAPKGPASRTPRRTIFRMCAGYLGLGGLWILFSDTALEQLGTEVLANPSVHIAKGLAFIVVTTMLLFLMFQHLRALTEQTRMKEVEERYRALYDRSLDCVLLADLEGRFIDMNRAALDLLGYERDTLGSLDFHSLVTPHDLPRLLSDLQEVVRTGAQAKASEYTLLRRDGEPVEVESKTSLVYTNGRPYALQAVVRDATERKRAERALALSAQVFEHSREGIMICDPDNRIVSVNRAFTTITGYEESEVLGETPKVLQSGYHDGRTYEALWRALETEGHWQGEIWNRRKNGELYPEWLAITEVRNRAGELMHRVGIFSDITERKQSEEQIRHLAEHDLLTKLPNRLLLLDRIEVAVKRALRQNAHAALLFIDLDRFKLVNDSLGHEVGDKLLKAVAERLQSSLRGSDTVSRHGGDEFLVLLPEISRTEDAGRIAEKLLAEIARPYRIDGYELALSGSIGITTFPENGRDVSTLLRNADAAMYAAKSSGRNRYQFFSADMNDRALERLELERDLRFAIERDEFFLAYQPQLELATGRITGLEALVRWHHATLGLVSPARFIRVAEESGLILAIGEWVMRAACRQLAHWKEREVLEVPISVNVSAVQFQQSDFLDSVSKILREEGLAPGDLELEVTESAVMKGAETMIGKLAELSRRGLRLAIDDFGTGYSSLSYLRNFPIQRLKIDGSFVRDLPGNRDAAAIARAIVGMGNSLSLEIVAEGVESEEQAAFLREIGCRDAQGYLFCRPLVAKDLEQWLSSRPAAPISGWSD